MRVSVKKKKRKKNKRKKQTNTETGFHTQIISYASVVIVYWGSVYMVNICVNNSVEMWLGVCVCVCVCERVCVCVCVPPPQFSQHCSYTLFGAGWESCGQDIWGGWILTQTRMLLSLSVVPCLRYQFLLKQTAASLSLQQALLLSWHALVVPPAKEKIKPAKHPRKNVENRAYELPTPPPGYQLPTLPPWL